MKKSNPLFSIIIPTYNREKFIFETVQSVLNQTHIDFELIIVDNKSTDKTKEIVLSFSDSRINFIQNDKNYERCYSRNVGIKISKGEYILFLDSDDLLENNHLLNWFNTLQDLNFTKGFFICRKKILNLDKILNDLNFKLFNSKRELLINLIQVPVSPGQVCDSKSILSEFQFNKEYLIFEDTALWLQIGNKFSPYFFDFVKNSIDYPAFVSAKPPNLSNIKNHLRPLYFDYLLNPIQFFKEDSDINTYKNFLTVTLKYFNDLAFKIHINYLSTIPKTPYPESISVQIQLGLQYFDAYPTL